GEIDQGPAHLSRRFANAGDGPGVPLGRAVEQLFRGDSGLAGERVAAAVHLDASPLAALIQRPVRVQDHVALLAGWTVRAREELAGKDQARADARAPCHVHHGPGPAPGSLVKLAEAARLASFSRYTGESTCSRSMAASGTFFQPARLGGLTSTPRTGSVGPGAPTPTPSSGPPSLSRRIWSVAHSTTLRGVRRASVQLRVVAMIRPSDLATATRTWVPPRSIPAII